MSQATPAQGADAAPSPMSTLVPHFRCDCVPDLGPAHCHRCGLVADRSLVGGGALVEWDQAPCRETVEGLAYAALIAAGETRALLVVSRALDAELALGAAGAIVPEPVEAQPDPPARPAVVPAAPKRRLISGLEHQLVRERSLPDEQGIEGSPWRFTRLATDQVVEQYLTLAQVAGMLAKPHTTTPAAISGVNHFVDGLQILVDDGCVISVILTPEEDREVPFGSVFGRPAASAPKRKSHSGGAGRTMPSNTKEMLERLRRHGFEAVLGNGGHYAVTHPGHEGFRTTVASSPSDRNSYINAIAEIKRRTGIDITR